MKEIILKAIEEEARLSAKRYNLYHNYLHINYIRKIKRLRLVSKKEIKIPDEWKSNKKHNPFYVLKHKEKIAASIAKKIKEKIYIPEKPFVKEIPKKRGGVRTISVYQLPDSAVSDKFYHDLIKKNKHRFSSFAYAYRNDRNIHFAIQDIANELVQTPRIFIAEFDFSNFFDSIDHGYIKRQLDENCFLISPTENYIISSFLEGREKGIPLGTSISLFLANLVCWRLDRKLEDEGLRFARYADDTIIWTRDYSKICKAFEIINDFSKATGILINYEKSEGISLLQNEGMKSEFVKHKNYIEFLGYKITVTNIAIRKSSVDNIKKQISYLLYKNLLEPLKNTPINVARFPTISKDEDFLTAISEIRRYLYGNLSEITLKKFLNGTYLKLNFKGIMSFYPLINDEKQMKDLDNWLISTILNTLKKRKQLLEKANYNISFFPDNLNSEILVNECKLKSAGIFQIPSFLRIYLALKMGVKNLGIDRVMNPESKYYDGW
jgi:hypothetical protein